MSTLRRAPIRASNRYIIVDFRPFNQVEVDEPTIQVWQRLVELSGLAGVRVTDWVVLGVHSAESVHDHLDRTAMPAEGRAA